MEEFTIEQKAVNTLRVLSAETILCANSGHSGIALSAAPAMYAIYKKMKFDPTDGGWFNRDRFVMSAGHGSALLYTTLKCFGVEGIDLSAFRKFGSELTGHPEVNKKLCIDCSTGPLGQGIAMAVGIALAEKRLAFKYNREGHSVVDHRTFCLVGDGCLMEGVSYEACNLAALWKLNKLIVVYDCNNITLDGTRADADAEDTAKRFKAIGWNVVDVPNANDEKVLSSRIVAAMTSGDAPTIIIAHTQIGFGSKNAGSHKAHGAVIPMEEIAEMRKNWGLSAETFGVDADVAKCFEKLAAKKKGLSEQWNETLENYARQFPREYAELQEFINQPYKNLTCAVKGKTFAAREVGHEMLNQLAKQQPRIWGGSADVASSTKAFVVSGVGDAAIVAGEKNGTADKNVAGGMSLFSAENPGGDNIAYGIREFAMAAISNGLALHGFLPYCSAFLAFSDYCRSAVRLSALMNLPVTYIFTHDGLGSPQDGATHQAGEHIASLRVVPNLSVYRPADEAETAAIFEYVFEQQKPACILLNRGDILLGNEKKEYPKPECNLLSSGSEVKLCIKAQTLLGALGVFVNVISIPCLSQFDTSTIDKKVPVLAVELGNGTSFWALFGKHKLHGDVISFDKFGVCGKDADVLQSLGFTPEKIADKVLKMTGKSNLTKIKDLF